MDSKNTTPSSPRMMPLRNKVSEKQKSDSLLWIALSQMFQAGGLMLSITLAAILLSGCCEPTYVYVRPAPYPLPDSSLMQPPLNKDLGEKFLSLSNSANSGSPTQPKTQPK